MVLVGRRYLPLEVNDLDELDVAVNRLGFFPCFGGVTLALVLENINIIRSDGQRKRNTLFTRKSQ